MFYVPALLFCEFATICKFPLRHPWLGGVIDGKPGENLVEMRGKLEEMNKNVSLYCSCQITKKLCMVETPGEKMLNVIFYRKMLIKCILRKKLGREFIIQALFS